MLLSMTHGSTLGRDVAQAVEHSAVKVQILLHGRLILHGGSIFSLGYFPFQPVIHNWSIKRCGMYGPVSVKVHIKDRLLLIGKSSLCGSGGFPLKKYVTMTICLTSNSRYENRCALKVSLNKTNFPFFLLIAVLFCYVLQLTSLLILIPV